MVLTSATTLTWHDAGASCLVEADLLRVDLQQTCFSWAGTVQSNTCTNTYSISDASTKSVQNATHTSTLPGTPTYTHQFTPSTDMYCFPFFWNPALTGVWRLLHCCGGQHDGHLPFWFPDFVKFIMLLLRVLFACWNKYTTVYADGVHEVAYHSYKLQWANVSNLICCCCCCTLWCIIYASQNAC